MNANFSGIFTEWSFVHYFKRGEENWKTWRKTRGAGTSTNIWRQKRDFCHMAPKAGFEPGPHWWEASALTTVPSLLPNIKEGTIDTNYCL